MLFRAPIIAWLDTASESNKKTISKKKRATIDKFIVNPNVFSIRKHLAPEVIFTMDDKIKRIDIVEDKDTDSTPHRYRSKFRRIARKRLLYANITFADHIVDESVMHSSVEKLMDELTFFNEEDNFFFKIFTDDLAGQEFFNLV